MKLYDWHIAPNPRRVHIYLYEKNIRVDLEEVGQDDLTLASAYKQKYPHAMVPMLELDDGTCIGEVTAICRFFEEMNPEPALFGKGAKERALVTMWENRANEEGMLAASELFRNTHPAFIDRGLPGSAMPVPQIPELRTRARQRLERFFSKTDHQLARSRFIVGPRYTMADITALCAIDFAKWSNVEISEDYPNLRRWYQDVSSRPSAKA
jgi:glutathione S-transferase